MSALDYKQCTLCPRQCKADRTKSVGFCGMGDKIYAAKAMVHTSEEPCISGTRGSGAVFFSGCVLKCAFCQNGVISHDKYGCEITEERLSQIFIELQSKGVHNINLVSGTHFYPSIINSLEAVGDKLNIPIVWNTGGYENAHAVDRLSRYCSIYLQDMKFYSSEISAKYSLCKDYYSKAIEATERMLYHTGIPSYDEEGIMQSGVIIRHLVLPSCRKDSIDLLTNIKNSIGSENVVLSLMSQYTPPLLKTQFKELSRRLTDFEYKSVCDVALELGFRGYFQDRVSADSSYTPDFDLSGL